MQKTRRRVKARHVIVPIALAVGIVSAATAVTANTGCGDDEPRIDAGAGDAMPDTPII